MTNANHQDMLANRLRSLRLAANLSIEKASELAGLTPGFWGEVERKVAEPCLNSLYGFAKALNITLSDLLTFDESGQRNDDRKRLSALLDLFGPEQLQFIHEVAKLTFNYKPRAQS